MSPREIEFNFMLKKLKRQTDSHELIFGREPESCVQGSMPRDTNEGSSNSASK